MNLKFWTWFRSTPPSRPTVASALAFLEDQPNIAEFLLANGHVLPVVYDRYSMQCPVAQYLSAETGLRCGGTHHSFYSLISQENGEQVYNDDPTPCPPRVAAFVCAFDRGEHKELRADGGNIR